MPIPPDFSKARCKDIGTELFYPEDDKRENGKYYAIDTLKAICAMCPVRNACLEWALHHETEGIWAATTPRQRQFLRKQYGITLKRIRPDEFIGGAA